MLAEAGRGAGRGGAGLLAWRGAVAGGTGGLDRQGHAGVTFAAGAAGMTWIGWPGASSNSATPLNRMYVVGTVVLLAVLPVVVRRYFGPVRGGWAPRAARVGGYAMVLALIAAKAAKDRYGSKLGAYFVIVPGLWVLDIVLLLVIAGYVAGLFILTSQRIRLTPLGPADRNRVGCGHRRCAVHAGTLSVSSVDPSSPSLKWWGLAALALPAATGLLAARLAARDTRPGGLSRCPAGLAWPRVAPWRRLPCWWRCSPRSRSRCSRTACRSRAATTPGHRRGRVRNLRPERHRDPAGPAARVLVELSVGQAGQMSLALLLLAPFLGAGLGAVAGGFASGSRGTSGRAVGGPHAPSPPAPTRAYRRLRASDADREQVIDVLKAAFVQGRLTKDELDIRAGHALTAPTRANLAALTADLHQPPRPS